MLLTLNARCIKQTPCLSQGKRYNIVSFTEGGEALGISTFTASGAFAAQGNYL